MKPNLNELLTELQTVTDKEKREDYIANSDKRVAQWPLARQQAFHEAVARLSGEIK